MSTGGPSTVPSRRVAVVGGGIAGLAAAWDLRGRTEVTVFEPGRIGGRILTEPFEGRGVDAGPDAFITRVPDALDLCREIGIEDLVTPAAGRTLIWWEGRTRTLPEGLVLGVPRRLGGLVRSGLIGPFGLVRAAGDLVLPRRPPADDVTVRELVASRFGAQVADRLVDPLVGGIHAGRTDRLSAQATVPQLMAAARRSRSLLMGLRSTPSGDPTAPIFAAPRGGMSELVERLTALLREDGVRFEAQNVEGAARRDGRWFVEPGEGAYDAVVLAVPAGEARRILGPGAPEWLGTTPRASVTLVTLGYPRLNLPPGVNGILVPRGSGMLSTACSFGSQKWPHWAASDRSVLRVSAGRLGEEQAMELDDQELVGRVAGEVRALLGPGSAVGPGSAAGPGSWRVSRWPDAFPQYQVGHQAAVEATEAQLRREMSGVSLCGASYHGTGIPACIASGRRAAADVLARLAAT